MVAQKRIGRQKGQEYPHAVRLSDIERIADEVEGMGVGGAAIQAAIRVAHDGVAYLSEHEYQMMCVLWGVVRYTPLPFEEQ